MTSASMRACRRRLWGLAVVLVGVGADEPSLAFAGEPDGILEAFGSSPQRDPWSDDLSGIEESAVVPGDDARALASGVLLVPRQIVDFFFWGSTVAIGVLAREQVVPRVQSLLATGEGRFVVLPTAFAETGRALNFGVRTIADFEWIATGFRVGFGGVDSVEMEPRIALLTRGDYPTISTLELLWARDDTLDFSGLGQRPGSDPRNAFVDGRQGTEAEYFEERLRAIAGFAVRVADDVELAASASLQRRRVDEVIGDGVTSLRDVFEEQSIPGAFERRWLAYGELSARFDTRPTRGRPSPGWLAESYAGLATGLLGSEARFGRVGGRLAAFVPVERQTNILSPKLVLEGLVPIGDAPVPFYEWTGQPDFLGIDDRVDNVSLVGSLDYRWLFVDHLAARLFVDVAVVAPELGALDFASMRPAIGAAFDLHIDAAEVGQIGVSASPEGPRVLLSIGQATGYGDRQHR